MNSLSSCAFETESAGHFFFTLPKLCIIGTTLRNESSIITCGKVFFRLSALLEVILYGDKMLNDKSNQRVLMRLSITLNVRNGLNRPYFKHLKVILSTISYKRFSLLLVDSFTV